MVTKLSLRFVVVQHFAAIFGGGSNCFGNSEIEFLIWHCNAFFFTNSIV